MGRRSREGNMEGNEGQCKNGSDGEVETEKRGSRKGGKRNLKKMRMSVQGSRF